MFKNWNSYNGNYGWDNLSRLLFLVAVMFTMSRKTFMIGLCIGVYAFYRTRSKNIEKRKSEARKFELFETRILSYLKNINFVNNLKFKVTRCPNCNQKVRLPKYKGNIVVTCPKCKKEFKFKT